MALRRRRRLPAAQVGEGRNVAAAEIALPQPARMSSTPRHAGCRSLASLPYHSCTGGFSQSIHLPICLSCCLPVFHLPADEECAVDWSTVDFTPMDFGGSTHPLQRIGLELPRGHGMAALTFVIRSEDGRC